MRSQTRGISVYRRWRRISARVRTRRCAGGCKGWEYSGGTAHLIETLWNFGENNRRVTSAAIARSRAVQRPFREREQRTITRLAFEFDFELNDIPSFVCIPGRENEKVESSFFMRFFGLNLCRSICQAQRRDVCSRANFAQLVQQITSIAVCQLSVISKHANIQNIAELLDIGPWRLLY